MDRRIIRWGLCGLLLTSVAVGATVSNKTRSPGKRSAEQATQSIHWMNDLQQAHRLANITGKPILIVFGGPGCQFCKKLDREVLQHPTIVRYINHTYVPVHLDAAKDAREAEILEVNALPTTIVLSPDADLLGTVEGFVGAKEYASVLKQASDFNKSLKQDQVASESRK